MFYMEMTSDNILECMTCSITKNLINFTQLLNSSLSDPLSPFNDYWLLHLYGNNDTQQVQTADEAIKCDRVILPAIPSLLVCA